MNTDNTKILEDEIKHLKEELAAKDAKYEALQKSKDLRETFVDSLKAKVKELEGNLKAEQNSVKKLETHLNRPLNFIQRFFRWLCRLP